MKWIWKHDQDFNIPTHIYLGHGEQMVGFVRKQVMQGYVEHWFARAYVSHTHDNGFFVKTLAEGKAIVEDMLSREKSK